MSKETIKRDKNGRFAKKGLPADGGMSQEEYIKQLKLERDAFKMTAEEVSGMYLNKCAEISKLKGEDKTICETSESLRNDYYSLASRVDQLEYIIKEELYTSLPWYVRWRMRRKMKKCIEITLDTLLSD